MNLLSLAILSAATTIVPSTSTVPVGLSDANLLTIERNIVERTNSVRARHGLQPLQIDFQLMKGARRQANWMAKQRVMQHGGAPVAENIAAGQSTSGEVMRDWLNSPGHRANILNGGYRRIGAAAFRGANGQIYWCQQFLR